MMLECLEIDVEPDAGFPEGTVRIVCRFSIERSYYPGYTGGLPDDWSAPSYSREINLVDVECLDSNGNTLALIDGDSDPELRDYVEGIAIHTPDEDFTEE